MSWRNRLNLICTGATLLVTTPALAWSEHHAITESALAGNPRFSETKVKVTSLDECVSRLGFASVAEFTRRNQWNMSYRFDFKLHEKPGDELTMLAVLSMYSDEPDWGMDKELFGPDQYPELWRPEYRFMGGTKGTPSQSFRHMYWQPLTAAHPIETFKIPPSALFKPMGAAPERAALFIDLSRKARVAGEIYWSLRFLANGLHYLEDVTQPFHATQTPMKKFYFMPLFDHEGSGLHGYVTQGTHIITYYHWAFEDYVGALMTDRPETAEGRFFVHDLSAPGDSPTFAYMDKDVAELVRKLAYISMTEARQAAGAAMDFFPPIQEPYLTLDVNKYLDAAWWKEVRRIGEGDSETKRRYFAVVQRMFGTLGEAIRAVVAAETGDR